MAPARFRSDAGDGDHPADTTRSQHDGALSKGAVSPPGRAFNSRKLGLRRLKRGIVRFLRCRSRERRLLLRAALVLAIVRAGLSLLPFKTTLRLMRRLQRPQRVRNSEPLQAREIAWGVRAASRLIPGATCLTQALAGRILLGRAGYGSELRIGVCKHAERGFEAHAWLEHGGETLLGELGDPSRFAPLPSLEKYWG